MPRPIKILYDSTLADNPAGTGVFVRALLASLRRISGLEVVTSTMKGHSLKDIDVRGRTAGSRVRNAVDHFSYFIRELPREARGRRSDAVFCPTSLGPLRGSIPTAITVYDLAPLLFPNSLDPVSGIYLRAMLRISVGRAHGVCALSSSTARDVEKQFGNRASNRIFVVHCAANPELLSARPQAAPIDQPFLLMVGTLEPRKNHVTAIRALADHLRRNPTSELLLVMAGSPGWRYKPLLKTIDELGLGSKVIRLGKVDVGVLKWLYQHARGLLFPSLYEGFGIPVLEALHLGCPVVASNIEPVIEIVGSEIGTLLPPTQVEAWGEAIDSIAARRTNRSALERGARKAAEFTWDRSAQAVKSSIDQILGVAGT